MLEDAEYAQIEAMRAKGLETHQIAERLGKSNQAILSMELRRGIKRRRPGHKPNPETARRNEEIYRMLKQGYSFDALAERFNLARETIKYIKHKQSKKEQSG